MANLPVRQTQSELFDSYGTHAYVFAAYPCSELVVHGTSGTLYIVHVYTQDNAFLWANNGF